MVTPVVGAGGGAVGTVDQVAALTPGAHTLAVTLLESSPSIRSYFDYWEAEANQPQARPILLPLQYQVPDAAFAPFAENRYVPTDAALVALDGVIRQVASHWGPNVIAVPLDLGLDPANYYADDAHPSTAGHALIAQQMLTALSAVTLTATPERGSTFTGWSGAGCSGTRPCTIALSHARAVSARFARSRL
jgi:hypothetical protein